MYSSDLTPLFPVILCGGSGSRLWPLSRSSYPKQFVDLDEGRTMFSETFERANRLVEGKGTVVILTNRKLQFYVDSELRKKRCTAEVIVEPLPRSTAAAIAAAAFFALTIDKEGILFVLPSDHVIQNREIFDDIAHKAVQIARKDYLVTLGITPSSPETGFGYIKAGSQLEGEGFKVDSFIEKPNSETAKKLLNQGNHYWNSGIFVFRASIYLQELKKFAPDIYTNVEKAFLKAQSKDKTILLEESSFTSSPSISIDYAVMEKTDNAAILPYASSWRDMGTWKSFYEAGKKDINSNVVKGDVLLKDSRNIYARSTNRLVAGVGIENLAIVETKDAILVSALERTQEVKEVVDELKRTGRDEVNLHPLVYRPWGSYELLARGDRFQVKRIVIYPGHSLSLQLHHHRAEHWIIVQGTAEVQIDEKVKLFTENQSTFIPIGTLHRMKNPGKIPLVVIEVQSGAYLGEDDIVRIEDCYGRV